MKRSFIVFMLFASIAASAEVLDLNFWLRIGYCPNDVTALYETGFIDAPGNLTMLTDLAAELVFLDLIFIGGGARTYFSLQDLSSGLPFQVFYNFKAGIRIGKNIEIGWTHNCLHPVLSSHLFWNTRIEVYDEIYVQFKGEINIF